MSSQPPPSLSGMRKQQIKPVRTELPPMDIKVEPPVRRRRVLEGLMPQRPRGGA